MARTRPTRTSMKRVLESWICASSCKSTDGSLDCKSFSESTGVVIPSFISSEGVSKSPNQSNQEKSVDADVEVIADNSRWMIKARRSSRSIKPPNTREKHQHRLSITHTLCSDKYNAFRTAIRTENARTLFFVAVVVVKGRLCTEVRVPRRMSVVHMRRDKEA